MNELIKILEEFEQNRSLFLSEGKWNEDAVSICFEPCAREILCNGYFLVNGKYIIDLGAIELYYHEEEGTIKDYIMYHIPERYQNPKSKVFKLAKEKQQPLPYFRFGSFNLHQSGVDVTFEKPNEYRASFLIRSYRVLENTNHLKDMTIPFDKCSTHIFDDMFYEGFLLSSQNKSIIEWKHCSEKGKLQKPSLPRRNVTKREYKYDESKKRYVISKLEEPDLRPWLFIREGIVEK